MKKSTLLLPLIIAVSFAIAPINGISQTKKIFHKSHSGSSGTIFMDDKNNYGPGAVRVEIEYKISPTNISYEVSDNNLYPKVLLDTMGKTMKFFDVNDSIIGCDRDYREYLNHGNMVYDMISKEYWVFQVYHNYKINGSIKTNIWFQISDSIKIWESKTEYVTKRKSFIQDGNYDRIWMHYPALDFYVTDKLTPIKIKPVEVTPIKLEEEVKEPTKKEKKLKKKKKTNQTENETKNQNEEQTVPAFLPKDLPPGNIGVWISVLFLVLISVVLLFKIQVLTNKTSKL